jgi:HEAT repeat protein
LEDLDPQVKFNSVVAIGNMKSTPSIEWNKIEAMLQQEEDPGLKQVALLALASHNHPKTEELSLPLLNSNEKTIRYAAAIVLIRFKREEVKPIIQELAQLKYDNVTPGELNGAQVEGLKVSLLENIEKSNWNELAGFVEKIETNDSNIRVTTKAKPTAKAALICPPVPPATSTAYFID